jgi:hypothetical protein
MDILQRMAKRIPAHVRKHILEGEVIDRARFEADIVHTPMHYLFELYEIYLDIDGEFNNWYCPRCREHVLKVWLKLKPYLEQENKTV